MKLVELESFLRDIDNVENIRKERNDNGDLVIAFDISADDGRFNFPVELHKTGFLTDISDVFNFSSEGDIMDAIGVEFADEDNMYDYELAADDIRKVLGEIAYELKNVIDLENTSDITRVLEEGSYMDADGNQHEASELLEHVPYYVLKGMVDEQPPLSDQIKKAMKEVYNEDIDSKNNKDFNER